MSSETFKYENPEVYHYGKKEGKFNTNFFDIPSLFSGDDMATLNERETENIVREHFRKAKKQYSAVLIEEQRTKNPRIEKLLKTASKQGKGAGKPEFIITFNQENDLIILIECKADVKKHESKDRDKPKEYAVDGVLLYASYLSKDYNVIAIAVSGQTKKELKVSTFVFLQGIVNYRGIKGNSLLSFNDYIKVYKTNPDKEKRDVSKLMKYSKKLHNDLRDVSKLSEPEKPLLVSAILIALENESFVSSYSKKNNASELAKLLVGTVKEVLEYAKLPEPKLRHIIQPYNFIEVHPELTRDEYRGKPAKILFELIKEIEANVKPFLKDYPQHDVIGQFYGEFLRYTGGDKKGLGIVLTPRHITELFVEIADVKKDDVVYDNCCGTGGFLISAMKKMVDDANGDGRIINAIKQNRLVGVEPQSMMYALGCANMILRGDGKANLYKEDSSAMIDTISQNHKCTVGFLNPPYSQKGEGLNELDFVLENLECLQKNSICVAIVPMNCATAPSPQKEELLKNHTLEAVMSMPNDLFYPVGIITCIMVLRAKVPHNPSRETWFGYWKDDGFVKTKHEGRIDIKHIWEKIKETWIDNYRNRKQIAGSSVLHKVTANDEWCAEAYMETDYKTLKQEDFEKEVKKYVLFKVINDE